MLQENWWILSRKAKRRKRMGNDNLSHGCFSPSSSFASSPCSDTIFFSPSPPSKAICGIVPWLVLRKMNFHLHLFAHCPRWFSGRWKKKSWFFPSLAADTKDPLNGEKERKEVSFSFLFPAAGGFLGESIWPNLEISPGERKKLEKRGGTRRAKHVCFSPISSFSFFGRRRDMNGEGGNSADFHPKKREGETFFPSPLSEKEKRGSWLGLSETHNTFLFLRFCLTRPNIFLILSLFPFLPREKALETWPKNTTTNKKRGKPRKPHTSVSLRCDREKCTQKGFVPLLKNPSEIALYRPPRLRKLSFSRTKNEKKSVCFMEQLTFR